jgi:hypothetical protein
LVSLEDDTEGQEHRSNYIKYSTKAAFLESLEVKYNGYSNMYEGRMEFSFSTFRPRATMTGFLDDLPRFIRLKT